MTRLGVKFGVLLVLIAVLSGCINGYQGNSYKSYVDPLTAENVVPLAEGEKPNLIFSQDIEADKEKYQDRGFVIIGESDFETTSGIEYIKSQYDRYTQDAIGHAMQIKATHILYLRKKISEFSETTVDEGKYETQFFERFQNVSVYMVRERLKL